MKLVGTSDVGMVRDINQDSFLMLENKEKNIIAFGVADGLGGHNAGELASALCMDILREYFNISNKEYQDMKNEVKGIIEYANKRILDFANENEENPQYVGGHRHYGQLGCRNGRVCRRNDSDKWCRLQRG